MIIQPDHSQYANQGCTNYGILVSRLRENGDIMRKWRGNGEKMRKWREIHSHISSFSFYFLPLYPFPLPKIATFWREMLKTALLSQISRKNLTYIQWENNSGSNSLRESSANCAGLMQMFCCSLRRGKGKEENIEQSAFSKRKQKTEICNIRRRRMWYRTNKQNFLFQTQPLLWKGESK